MLPHLLPCASSLRSQQPARHFNVSQFKIACTSFSSEQRDNRPALLSWLTKQTFCMQATPLMAFAAQFLWLLDNISCSVHHSPAHQGTRTRSKRARRLAGLVSPWNRTKRLHRSATGTNGKKWVLRVHATALERWIYVGRFTLSGAAQLRT